MRYLVAFVVIVVIVIAVSASSSNGPKVGQDARIHTQAATAPAASYLDDLATSTRAAKAGNQSVVQSLAASQRVIALVNGTRVHVVSAFATGGYWDVRILEGQYAGVEVWVQWDDLAP